ncbi:angiopoietin-related protein 6-like isoform X2 [Mytilus galloprovincialis]|uniref:angiopoietin-related protein 6-like isoform X2 n=1 Tax=Mytilus galloprovincialis TaxID=29158 RepID=UPI003F7BED6A
MGRGMKKTLILAVVCVCLSLVNGLDEEAVNENDIKQYQDCGAARKLGGYQKSGVYKLWMNTTKTYFKIICEHTPNNSFNVIQRRVDGRENFNRLWHDYVAGFGSSQADYWAGLNSIYYLTNHQGNSILTVNLQDWAGINKNARYNYFKLMDSTHFRLSIGGYSGDTGDSMSQNNNMVFATPDKLDTHRCAAGYQGGWWFNYCTYAFLNGKYYYGGPYQPSGQFYDGIYWYSWGGYGYSMKFAQMMLSSS